MLHLSLNRRHARSRESSKNRHNFSICSLFEIKILLNQHDSERNRINPIEARKDLFFTQRRPVNEHEINVKLLPVGSNRSSSLSSFSPPSFSSNISTFSNCRAVVGICDLFASRIKLSLNWSKAKRFGC